MDILVYAYLVGCLVFVIRSAWAAITTTKEYEESGKSIPKIVEIFTVILISFFWPLFMIFYTFAFFFGKKSEN